LRAAIADDLIPLILNAATTILFSGCIPMTTPVEFGLLAMYAEDMYVDGALLPAPEPRIATAGWDIVAYLIAQDVLIPSAAAPTQRLGVDPTKRVFYGFLAKDKSNPASFVAVVRGTEGIIEWLIDADFLLIPHPRHAAPRWSRDSGTFIKR
jgi:hypothetical protein